MTRKTHHNGSGHTEETARPTGLVTDACSEFIAEITAKIPLGAEETFAIMCFDRYLQRALPEILNRDASEQINRAIAQGEREIISSRRTHR